MYILCILAAFFEFFCFTENRKVKHLSSANHFNILMESQKVQLTKPKNTTPKTDMSPENQWLEDVFPIEIVPF